MVGIVPFKVLVHLAVIFHQELAHIGKHKLHYAVGSLVWHPAIYRVTNDVCVTCDICQKFKISHQTKTPPTLKIETTFPFQLVAMDCVNFPRTSRGNIGCLVAVDHFSKWIFMEPLKDKKSSTIAKIFEEFFLPSMIWLPETILTDNGSEFQLRFPEVLLRYGIKHTTSSPYKPSSNGAVERVNRTIGELLRLILSHGGEWDIQLPKVKLIYNNTVHSQTGKTPAQKLMEESHKRRSRVPLSDEHKLTWKEGHPNFRPFKLNQAVARKVITQDKTNIRKFTEKYTGPYIITKVFGNEVTYEISSPPPGKIQTWRVHHQHLKIWHYPPEYLKNYFRTQETRLEDAQELQELQEHDVTNTGDKELQMDRLVYWEIDVEDIIQESKSLTKRRSRSTQTYSEKKLGSRNLVDAAVQCELVVFSSPGLSPIIPWQNSEDDMWSVDFNEECQPLFEQPEGSSRGTSVSEAGEEIGSRKAAQNMELVPQFSSTMLEDSMDELSRNLAAHEVRFPPRKEKKLWHNSSLDIWKTRRMNWRKEERSERFMANRKTLGLLRESSSRKTPSPRKPLTRSMGKPKHFSNVQERILEYKRGRKKRKDTQKT
ncbi:UNVERIFIED_CONTAM: hypothetical protein RMT77_019624 [Armadillidium vulgare]